MVRVRMEASKLEAMKNRYVDRLMRPAHRLSWCNQLLMRKKWGCRVGDIITSLDGEQFMVASFFGKSYEWPTGYKIRKNGQPDQVEQTLRDSMFELPVLQQKWSRPGVGVDHGITDYEWRNVSMARTDDGS